VVLMDSGIRPSTSAGAPAQRTWAGFDFADLAWERSQEQAALAYRAGGARLPLGLWARGLEIAERQFGRGDPRLAASLTCRALAMRRMNQVYQAQKMFGEALAVWDETWRWVHLMSPPHGPRPSQFARWPARGRPGLYKPEARAWFAALAGQGRAVTAALERYDVLPMDGLALWFAIKPRELTDVRKLLAAVLLLPGHPH
jgi:hypothetical protein